jgi:hypothetical protein
MSLSVWRLSIVFSLEANMTDPTLARTYAGQEHASLFIFDQKLRIFDRSLISDQALEGVKQAIIWVGDIPGGLNFRTWISTTSGLAIAPRRRCDIGQWVKNGGLD